MKRAIFVAVGTIAGLTATLRYTPENPLLTAGTDLALGGSQTLGDAQSVAPAIPNSAPVPAVTASKTASASATSQAKPQKVIAGKTSNPKAAPKKTSNTKPQPKKSVKPKPKPTVKPKPKPTVKPTVKPTPTAQPVSFTGASAAAAGYGTVQVSIQVLSGRMTSITPLNWPKGGTSSGISSYSIPILIQDALGRQSANVASVSGASYTSQAFKSSLASAMAQAGL